MSPKLKKIVDAWAGLPDKKCANAEWNAWIHRMNTAISQAVESNEREREVEDVVRQTAEKEGFPAAQRKE